MSRNNILSPVDQFDVSKIIFSEVQENKVPNTTISIKRMNISVLNEDGSVGDLIFPTEKLYSFGVSENKAFGNPDQINGYTLPLCLWNKNGPTKEERHFTDTFNAVVEHCKKHLVENREELGKGFSDLDYPDLKRFNPLYWKKDEKGKIVEGTGPTLYAKLIQSKKDNKMISVFRNEEDEIIDPMTLIGKKCFARAAIKIESIFLGAKIGLQVKLYQVYIEPIESGMKSLLTATKKSGNIIPSNQGSSKSGVNPLTNPVNPLATPSEPDIVDDDAPIESLMKPEPKTEPKKAPVKVRLAKK